MTGEEPHAPRMRGAEWRRVAVEFPRFFPERSPVGPALPGKATALSLIAIVRRTLMATCRRGGRRF